MALYDDYKYNRISTLNGWAILSKYSLYSFMVSELWLCILKRKSFSQIMTTPIAPSSITSSDFPISLAALTNNFSTHLNADNYLLWRDQITPSSSAMTFMSILMALIRLLQKPFLLTTLLLQI